MTLSHGAKYGREPYDGSGDIQYPRLKLQRDFGTDQARRILFELFLLYRCKLIFSIEHDLAAYYRQIAIYPQ
ncbi:Uncharacterized protein HZ326_24645 [Fusarium oxysporum f. sp. albedinis]|nr:Uncharacterized protein HZ326_24645 [Fusarium oxysporum f. sp. albedinis]